jgi:hypothetical protein
MNAIVPIEQLKFDPVSAGVMPIDAIRFDATPAPDEGRPFSMEGVSGDMSSYSEASQATAAIATGLNPLVPVASGLAGIAGAGYGAVTGKSPIETAARWQEKAAGALTVPLPETKAAQEVSGYANKPFELIHRAGVSLGDQIMKAAPNDPQAQEMAAVFATAAATLGEFGAYMLLGKAAKEAKGLPAIRDRFVKIVAEEKAKPGTNSTIPADEVPLDVHPDIPEGHPIPFLADEIAKKAEPIPVTSPVEKVVPLEVVKLDKPTPEGGLFPGEKPKFGLVSEEAPEPVKPFAPAPVEQPLLTGTEKAYRDVGMTDKPAAPVDAVTEQIDSIRSILPDFEQGKRLWSTDGREVIGSTSNTYPPWFKTVFPNDTAAQVMATIDKWQKSGDASLSKKESRVMASVRDLAQDAASRGEDIGESHWRYIVNEAGESKAITDVARGVISSADDVNKAFAPYARGEQAQAVAGIIREKVATEALSREKVYEKFKAFDKEFQTIPEPKRLEYIDAVENGKSTGNAAADRAFAVMRSVREPLWKKIQELKGTEAFIENYFPHFWEQPDVASRVLGRRPLAGPASFRRGRKIPTIKEGMELGLKPKTTNPVELETLKINEMLRFIKGTEIINGMKAQGLAKFVRAFEKPPEGYVKINDKIGTVYGPSRIPVWEAFDKKVRDGLNATAERLGIDHERLTRIGGKRAGYASPTGKIVSKFGGPDSVIAHEIGHQVDWKYGLKERLVKNPEFKKELRVLADLRYEGTDTTPTFKKYVRKGEEKMAVMLEAYIHAPEKFKTAAPNTWAYFSDLIKNTPELQPLADIHPSLVLGSDVSTVPAGGMVIKGNYYLPEPAGRVLNNYLSPGLWNRSAIYDVFRGAGNFMNQVQLGMSAFHFTFTSIDAVTSRFALGLQELGRGQLLEGAKHVSPTNLVTAPVEMFIKGNKLMKGIFAENPEFAHITDALIKGGGRVKMDLFYKNSSVEQFWKALGEGKYGKAGVQAIPAVIEAAAKPVMEYWVPRMKLGIFSEMAESQMAVWERIGHKPTVPEMRQAYGKIWDSIDNRMGQMVYDNLFWNRTLKDVGLASVRSLGWNLGTLRELGGGVKDVLDIKASREGGIQISPRTAYVVALPAVVAMYGAMYQYTKTGKGPQELRDYFFPKTGRKTPDGRDERISLPSYIKDIYAYGKHPLTTIGHKVHPVLSSVAQMLENKDYYGVMVRNPNDPKVKQATDFMQYVGTQFIPFSVRGAQMRGKSGADVGEQAESFFGLIPAPKGVTQTKAEELLGEFTKRHMEGGPITREEQLKKQTKADIRDKFKRGQVDELRTAIDKSGLQPAEIHNLIRNAKKPGLITRFLPLSPSEAMQVWRIASTDERNALYPVIVKKIAASKTISIEDKKKYIEKIRASK